MKSLSDVRVEPVPGEGFMYSRPGSLLVCFGRPDSASATKLRVALSEVDGDGLAAARALAAVVVTMPRVEVDPFCLIADSQRGLVAMVHGGVTVRDGSGRELFNGDDSPTWVDGFIDSVDSALEIAPTGTAPNTSTGPWDITEGLIPSGGALLIPTGNDDSRAVVESHEHTPHPRSSQNLSGSGAPEGDTHFELIDLTRLEPPESRPPLSLDSVADETSSDPGSEELVSGTQCSRGHFNHPDARYCALCGIKMIHVTKVSVEGRRPPLGLLVLDDGATFALGGSYVVGREPEGDPLVRAGEARPLTLTDSSNSVSRIHAEIRLEGWDVNVIDRGSSNGTFLHIGDGHWSRLDPATPTRLEPGNELSIGERRLVFESNVVPARG